jgi:hypothetical protein
VQTGLTSTSKPIRHMDTVRAVNDEADGVTFEGLIEAEHHRIAGGRPASAPPSPEQRAAHLAAQERARESAAKEIKEGERLLPHFCKAVAVLRAYRPTSLPAGPSIDYSTGRILTSYQMYYRGWNYKDRRFGPFRRRTWYFPPFVITPTKVVVRASGYKKMSVEEFVQRRNLSGYTSGSRWDEGVGDNWSYNAVERMEALIKFVAGMLAAL